MTPGGLRVANVFHAGDGNCTRWLGAMLDLAPWTLPNPPRDRLPTRRVSLPVQRVALLEGCAQSVLEPSINAATVRLLDRHGVEVVPPAAEGCCGALGEKRRA